jgi:threonine/homoserine efflux transporter RhtA
MKIMWWVLAIYMIGFLPILVMEMTVGPVTPGLALLRAVVWPLYVTTGRPQGVRYGERCDDDECG